MFQSRRILSQFPARRLATPFSCPVAPSAAVHAAAPTSPRVRLFSSYKRSNELIVSILGPPNAGKSTLFNRLQCKERNRTYRLGSDARRNDGGKGRIGSRQRATGNAIVSNIPGTTRDRRECWGRIGGTEFKLIDTAGVDGERIGLLVKRHSATASPIETAMIQQTLAAAKECDLVLLMFDARVGLTQDLTETARWLRKLSTDSQKPRIVIVANKLEGDRWAYDGSPTMDHLHEAERLGFGEAIPISAGHGDGMADIAIVMEQMLSEKRATRPQQEVANTSNSDEPEKEKPLQLAILGRQNVGKSTLVNALLKQERVISGATPGLTRDAISIEWMWEDRAVQIVDTAGIRKLTQRLDDDIEDMAVADALRAMKTADVAVLVLDAQAQYLQRQELAIASAVIDEGRALVVVANKMDLLDLDGAEYTRQDFANAVREQLEARIPMLRQTPIVAMSSLTGECVNDLMPVVFRARERWARTVKTGTLNRWLHEVLDGASPPVVGGIQAKIKYIMQTKGRPPTFLLFCNVEKLPEPYLRYLTKNFQDTFEMYGMQIRMIVKLSAQNPFEAKEALRTKRSGYGLGGKENRKKRMIQQLKATGKPAEKRKRNRDQNQKYF